MGVRRFSIFDRGAVVDSWRRSDGLVVFVFRRLAGGPGRFFLGGTEADAGPLAGAAAVLSGGDGRCVLCFGRGGAIAGPSESGPAAARLGSRAARRNSVRGLGTAAASVARRCDDGGLPVFLLLPYRRAGTLLPAGFAAVSQVHRGSVHDVWTGVHGLHGAAGRRPASVDDVWHSAARLGAGLDAQAGERRQQFRGRVPQRASGGDIVSAAV